MENGTLVTSGGRVMAVSATADSLEEAIKLAYTGVSMVSFKGMIYRRDIAHRFVLQKLIQGD
jgi:phosphoribosylamine--glycine ligase/phosphoribosylformylglycinamidine cyclo-ligase